MREIVSLHLGQCGNRIGTEFWNTISEEHGINQQGQFQGEFDSQSQRLDVYFNEVQNGRYVPRSIFADLDPESINKVKCSKVGQLLNPDLMIEGDYGTSNNWAKGSYSLSYHIDSIINDLLWRLSEKCDSLAGYQITHSLGGGTGSGFGKNVIQLLEDQYCDKIKVSFTVLPSPKASNNVFEVYNTTLSIESLMTMNGCMLLDNNALDNICTHKLNIPNPTYHDLNRLISDAMSGVTCSFRFPGQLNSDLRKLCVNLVPFPQLHFLMLNQQTQFNEQSVSELTQMFDAKSMMCSADPRKGRYLTGAAIYRGLISTSEIDEQVALTQSKNSSYWVEWIPDNIQTIICNIPQKNKKISGTFIGNSTAIIQAFTRIAQQFESMFKKKAFVHYYYQEGMEESEFIEAETNLNDLILEYQQYQDYHEQNKQDEEIQHIVM